MELTVTNQTISSEPEPRYYEFAIERLSNSNYKKIVEETYKTASSKSVFGIRQHLKINQYHTINTIGVFLKLTLFAIVIGVLF